MNFTRLSKKFLSLALTVAMLLSLCAPTITVVAEGVEDQNAPSEKLHYVSLGDSMSNGYGLDGYDHNSGVADYGDGAYANQFAAWLEKKNPNAAVTHAQLAMSGIRTEDVHWLLEFDYNNAELIEVLDQFIKANTKEPDEVWDQEKWNEYFTCGDYWTVREICNHTRTDATFAHIAGVKYEEYTGCDHKQLVEFPETVDQDGRYTMGEKVAVIAKYYQENVAAADVISLSVGNGNLGVFGFGRILEVIGFETTETYKNYNYEDLLRECEPEMKEYVMSLIDELKPTLTETVENETLVDVALYISVSLILNYAGTLDAILQSNPDVEIILVPIM